MSLSICSYCGNITVISAEESTFEWTTCLICGEDSYPTNQTPADLGFKEVLDVD